MFKSPFTLPETEFTFAGFNWPKQTSMLPRGTRAERLERARKPVCGPYYASPKPNTSKATFFYLDSDFMPGLRWQWADEVDGACIRHTGWFTNEFQDDKIRGIVMRLPRSRGFLAGWSMGEQMASEVEYYIWDDEAEAARAADSSAQHAAERQREAEEADRAQQEAEEAKQEAEDEEQAEADEEQAEAEMYNYCAL